MGTLRSIPDVKNVGFDGGEIIYRHGIVSVRTLDLYVYTLLPEANHLQQLPSIFSGFRVHQLNLGDKRESFLRTWKRLFKEVRGWNEAQTIEWAQKWAGALEGRYPSAVYHYGPVKLAVSSLIDENTKSAIDASGPLALRKFYNEVQDVIWGIETGTSAPIQHPDTADDYDWDYVRKRIAELIDKYSNQISPKRV